MTLREVEVEIVPPDEADATVVMRGADGKRIFVTVSKADIERLMEAGLGCGTCVKIVSLNCITKKVVFGIERKEH